VESGFDYRGARFYDGDVARFNSLDPLAAEFPEWSDYNYVLGNPLILIDSDGRNPRPPKVYLIDFAGLDMDVISGHVRDIFAKNGFEITTEVITPEQALEITPLSYPGVYGISIVRGSRVSHYSSIGNTEENPAGDFLIARQDDDAIRTSTYANHLIAEQDNKGNGIFAVSYIAAHEVLHQMLKQAYKHFGYTDEIQALFTDTPGEHYNSEPNLNRAAKYTEIPYGGSKKLRPEERILYSNQQRDLLECFFSEICGENLPEFSGTPANQEN